MLDVYFNTHAKISKWFEERESGCQKRRCSKNANADVGWGIVNVSDELVCPLDAWWLLPGNGTTWPQLGYKRWIFCSLSLFTTIYCPFHSSTPLAAASSFYNGPPYYPRDSSHQAIFLLTIPHPHDSQQKTRSPCCCARFECVRCLHRGNWPIDATNVRHVVCRCATTTMQCWQHCDTHIPQVFFLCSTLKIKIFKYCFSGNFLLNIEIKDLIDCFCNNKVSLKNKQK